MHNFIKVYNYFIKELEDKWIIKKYQKKENIFSDGDKKEKIYIIKSGEVEINKCTLDWDKRIIFILSEGYILNEEILLSEKSNCTTNAKAYTDVELYSIDKSEIIKKMREDFKLTEYILYNSNMKLKRAYRQLKNTGTSVNLDKKIVSKLWKLSLDYGVEIEEGILIDIPITSTIISKMIGAKRESVSRKINLLKKKGIINIKDEKIIILDYEEFYKLLS